MEAEKRRLLISYAKKWLRLPDFSITDPVLYYEKIIYAYVRI